MGLSQPQSVLSFAKTAQILLAFILILAIPNVYAAHEVAILIDTSGSMIQNDPKNLRKPAIRLASQMLPMGSKAGIWLFDSRARTLIRFNDVTAQWKKNTTKQSTKVHSKGQWTNIESALLAASKAFSKEAESKSIILLTDGQVDISKTKEKNTKSRKNILTELLGKLQNSQIQVHSIALSKNADQDLLQRLAVGTNGMFALANTADELMSIFLRAFDQSIAADQVPLEGNTFSVDASIKEFTVLIFRKAGSPSSKLKTPSGGIISKDEPGATQWYTDTLYDLVTVATPETGDWTLDAELDPDNRVTIVSDMELNLQGLPNNIIQGQQVTLKFFLADSTGPIAEPSLLSLLDIDFEQTILSQPPKVLRAKVTSHTQGKVRTPKGGIFSAKLSKTLINGEHQFTVTVDGKTFKREQTKRARVFAQVMEPMVVNQPTDDAPMNYFINLLPIKGLVDPKSLELSGSVKKPSGQIEPVDVEKTKFGSWTLAVPPLEGKKSYKAFVTVKGMTSNGDEFNLTQGPILVDYSKPLTEMKQPSQDLFDQISDEGDKEEQKEAKEVIEKTQPKEMPQSEDDDTSDSILEDDEDEVDEEEDEETSDDESEDGTSASDDEDFNDEDSDDGSSEADGEDGASEEEESEPLLDSTTMLYGGIGLANLVLFVGLFFFIRRWMKKRKAAAAEEDRALLEEVDKVKNQAKKKVKDKSKAAADAAAKEEPIDDSLTAEAAKISDMLDNIDDADGSNE